MTEIKKYIKLNDLEVYKLARELSQLGWKIYEPLTWQDKKITGDQFIESTDSVGANIAEGYKRFHYLDKIRFYYNARASLCESGEHWLELLFERKKVSVDAYNKFKDISENLSRALNKFIETTYKSKKS